MQMRNKSLVKVVSLIIASLMYIGLTSLVIAETRFEHMAINVENPKAVADWYVKYLGLKSFLLARR